MNRPTLLPRTLGVLLLLLLPGITRATTYILIVGVNHKAQRTGRRDTFAHEARQVRAAFLRRPVPRKENVGLPGRVVVRSYLGKAATRRNILAGLAWLERMTARDTAFLYFTTHGGRSLGHGFFLAPWGFSGWDVRRTAVTGAELQARVARLRGPSVLCLDTCHSGEALRQRGGWGKSLVLAACRAWEKAYVGALSPALVKALRGRADFNRNGVVEIGELRRAVLRYMHRYNARQHPVVYANPRIERARLVRV